MPTLIQLDMLLLFYTIRLKKNLPDDKMGKKQNKKILKFTLKE